MDPLCDEGLKQQSAMLMRRAKYCLVPRGDTPSSSRFYDAVACGCVPVVISDAFELAFAPPPSTEHGSERDSSSNSGWPLDYSSAVIRVPEAEFVRAPVEALAQRLRLHNDRSGRERREALRRLSHEVDYRASGHAVADNFLAALWKEGGCAHTGSSVTHFDNKGHIE